MKRKQFNLKGIDETVDTVLGDMRRSDKFTVLKSKHLRLDQERRRDDKFKNSGYEHRYGRFFDMWIADPRQI